MSSGLPRQYTSSVGNGTGPGVPGGVSLWAAGGVGAGGHEGRVLAGGTEPARWDHTPDPQGGREEVLLRQGLILELFDTIITVVFLIYVAL